MGIKIVLAVILYLVGCISGLVGIISLVDFLATGITWFANPGTTCITAGVVAIVCIALAVGVGFSAATRPGSW